LGRDRAAQVAAHVAHGRAGNADFRVLKLPSTNHSLEVATSGALDEVGVIDHAISPAALPEFHRSLSASIALADPAHSRRSTRLGSLDAGGPSGAWIHSTSKEPR
jgi:hypothetical protein